MLQLRPYKPDDAPAIASWIKSETALRQWGSDRFAGFPVTAEDINEKYLSNNGDCTEADNFYPFTATDESGAVGHLIMRYTGDKRTLRFGFVIVDDSRRGQGYGKEMLRLALRYAFEVYHAERVTLGVFENNPAAFYCYRAVGFRALGDSADSYYDVAGEQWKCLELAVTREAYDGGQA